MPTKARTYSKTGNKNSRNHCGTLCQRSKAKSGSTAKSVSSGIFRPDLLNYNPTEKSGYMFFNIELPVHEKHIGKVEVAKAWLECLQSHPEYKTIYLPHTSDLSTIFQKLHEETEKLLKGYSWILAFPDEQEPILHYYKSLGDIGNYQLPMDWFDKSQSFEFRMAGTCVMLARRTCA